MTEFKLVPGLAKKDLIFELPLCYVLMDDKEEFPWLFLVPRKPEIIQMNNLTTEDQMQLMKEITLATNIMESLFPCDRVNVAAIGNMTPQLHVHIICRTKDDKYWPDVVWNKPLTKISATTRTERINKIKNEFEKGEI